MRFEGGCYCRKVRYVAEGDPVLKAQCHCRECQYISGGAPNMFMLMPPQGFAMSSGAPKTFTRDDLERPVTREFCENCGAHLTTPEPPSAAGDPEGRHPRRPEPLRRPADGDQHPRHAALPYDPGRRAGVRAAAAALKQIGSKPRCLRHCEERSEEAIQRTEDALRSVDCFASLAMTATVRAKCNPLWSTRALNPPPQARGGGRLGPHRGNGGRAADQLAGAIKSRWIGENKPRSEQKRPQNPSGRPTTVV